MGSRSARGPLLEMCGLAAGELHGCPLAQGICTGRRLLEEKCLKKINIIIRKQTNNKPKAPASAHFIFQG